MKKVRVEVYDDSPGRRFWLFSSSLELWQWILSCYEEPGNATEGIAPAGAHEIVLRPGGFLEVEWCGTEPMQDVNAPGGWRYLNLVRIGEAQPTANASGNVVTIHMGWVISSIIPMEDYEDNNIDVWRIDDDEEAELDLDALFREKGIEF